MHSGKIGPYESPRSVGLKERFLGFSIAVIAVTISLLGADVALRWLTEFPVNNVSNRMVDKDLGYRLSTHLPDVDANGFRNRKTNSLEGSDILAVGDSHTYGNNVASENSWPAVLSRATGLKVYNSGVGSYGIATYHALQSRFMNVHPNMAAIVAVYPNNDFAAASSFCEIDFSDQYWTDELRRLKLKFRDLQLGCRDAENPKKGIISWIKTNSAIISAVNELIFIPRRIASRSTSAAENLPRIDLSGLIRDEKGSRIEEQFTKLGLSLIADWAISWNHRIGLLLIPSKPRVFYEIQLRRNQLNSTNPDLIRVARHDIELELLVQNVAEANEIPVESALEDLVAAMEKNSNLYPIIDGHPREEGYIAYAAAAQRLVERLGLKTKR